MHYMKGKGWFESSGKLVGSDRTVSLRLAKVYGYEGDRKSFTRLLIESRVAQPLMLQAFAEGQSLKQRQLQTA